MKWPKRSIPITKKQWTEIKPEVRAKKQFVRREPINLLGSMTDITHMRFVDTATSKELLEENRKIQAKESKLPKSQRDIITTMFQ
jgi:hypothetical protein